MSKVYISLPVKDVAAARTFYAQLGFKLNVEYSNDENATIDLNDGVSLMLASEEFFGQNEKRDIADTSKVAEVNVAIEGTSREEVDKMFEAGIAAGGEKAGETVEIAEIGMYARSLLDLDKHRLDLVAMGK